MKKLKTIKAIVKLVLENNEKARNDDNYLYLVVIQLLAKASGINLANISVVHYLTYLSNSNFPPFESVRRTRQKIQAECPHLAPCKKVEELRAENEVAYREFARS